MPVSGCLHALTFCLLMAFICACSMSALFRTSTLIGATQSCSFAGILLKAGCVFESHNTYSGSVEQRGLCALHEQHFEMLQLVAVAGVAADIVVAGPSGVGPPVSWMLFRHFVRYSLG